MTLTVRHTVIIEYHLTDAETDQMVVRNVYGELAFARKRCRQIRSRLGDRPNVIVDAWRIEDAMERVVARGKA